jgi:hypothetical protein
LQLPDAPYPRAAEELARVIAALLSDDERRRAMGERARRALDESRGATARTVELVAPLIENSAAGRGRRAVSERNPNAALDKD